VDGEVDREGGAVAGLAALDNGITEIARASFLLPDIRRKASTRAFLLFLEQQGLLESTAEIERRAILAERHFSQIRFPSE
jgi:hypothetical protein